MAYDLEVNTLAEIVSTVQSDLTVDSTSSLMDPGTIRLAVARAYRKIASMFLWPETKDSQKTSTMAGQEYYDYPQNWLSDSVWKLMVDGVDYGDPLAYKDYLSEQANNYPSGLQNLWASENRRYFITTSRAVPAANGTNNIVIWGHKFVDALTQDGDVTVFSYSRPVINEAIILEATAILKQKGEIMQVLRRLYISGSELLSTQATSLVNQQWQKYLMQQAKNAKSIPMLSVPDMFAGGQRKNNIKWSIGNFNTNS